MARMMRCLAQITIHAGGKVETLWPGLDVNFDREIVPGVTIEEAVRGRESCFEPVAPAPAEAAAHEDGQ